MRSRASAAVGEAHASEMRLAGVDARARTDRAGFGFGIPRVWRILRSRGGGSGGDGGGVCVGVLRPSACNRLARASLLRRGALGMSLGVCPQSNARVARLHPDPAVAAQHDVNLVSRKRAEVLLQALDEHRRHAHQLTAQQAAILRATRVQSNAAVAEKRLHFSLRTAATAKHACAGVAAARDAHAR